MIFMMKKAEHGVVAKIFGRVQMYYGIPLLLLGALLGVVCVREVDRLGPPKQ